MTKINYLFLIYPQILIAAIFILIIRLDFTSLSSYDGLFLSTLVLVIYLTTSLALFIFPNKEPNFFASRCLLMISLQILAFLTSVVIFVYAINEVRLLLYFLILFLIAMSLQTALLVRNQNKK
jgi:hypothetical protein